MRARRTLATAIALGLALGANVAAFAATPAWASAAAPLPGSAVSSMTCDQILWEPVTIALADAASVFDESRMTDVGGLSCTWIDIGQEFTLAYAPVDDEQRAAAVAELEAAGLERADSPEGIRFHSAETEQAGPLDGDHLFADGHWYAVQVLSVGSGGFFLVPGTDQATDGVRTRVLQAVGANTPAPTPTPASTATGAPAAATPPPPPPPTEAQEPTLAADQPSVLSGLAPAGAAPVTVASVASTAGTAMVLAALVAIPNRLVDMTAGALADRRRRRAIAGVTDALTVAERIRRLVRRVERALHPVAGITIGLIVAGALTALIDPRAGATLGTLRLAASATLGYAIEGLLGLLLVAWLLRRGGASVGVRFRPVSLVIVLGAIVVSRLIGFEPGFVFGIVLALIFLRPSPEHERRAALLELGYLAALGVAAWLVYSVIQVNVPPTGPLGLLGLETLAGLTIGCLMALPLLLSPVGELPGTAIWRRGRMLWAGTFIAAMALVVWVVMPFPAAWDAVHTPVVAWVVLLVAYSVVAAALWAAVTRPWSRADASARAGTSSGAASDVLRDSGTASDEPVVGDPASDAAASADPAHGGAAADGLASDGLASGAPAPVRPGTNG
ncbi:hypothetical protein [Agrococcus sp. Ld7]|uniref:hypothetical protein n=1 Tax=Agrococcus sp. Ld7 TaxID=649148 RepID=UPI00386E475D